MPSSKDILNQSDIEEELRMASLQGREASFEDKIISSLILKKRTVESGINLKNAIVMHIISLEETTINGSINLTGAVVKESFYAG